MGILLKSIEDGVGYITLNRPEKYNSYNKEMAYAFREALDEFAANSEVRCVYITGAGKGFCSGQDLSEATNPTPEEFERIVKEHYNAVITRIRHMEKPVIAAVNGVAAGAGANLALACDIVVAAESATFIQAFIKIGLIPDCGGTYMLPRLVGMQRAAGLMMTAEKVSAKDAVAMGMIYKCFPDDVFVTESRLMAATLAKMPTLGMALTKKLLNESFGNSLEAQLEREQKVQAVAGASYDFKEGVQAFLEKRLPEFIGR